MNWLPTIDQQTYFYVGTKDDRQQRFTQLHSYITVDTASKLIKNLHSAGQQEL